MRTITAILSHYPPRRTRIQVPDSWDLKRLTPSQVIELSRVAEQAMASSSGRTIDLAEPTRPSHPTWTPPGANRGERVQAILDAVAPGDTRGRTVAENVDTSPPRSGFSAIDRARGLDGHVARQQEADLAEHRHQLAARTRQEVVDDVLAGHALVSDGDLARRKADRIQAQRDQNLADIAAALGRGV